MTTKTQKNTEKTAGIFAEIPREIETRGSRIIMLTGGSGSGKTTLARYIAEKIYPGESAIISHDMYYIDKDNFEPDYRVDYDAPESLDNELLRQHVAALKKGKAVDTPIYDFQTRDRLEDKQVRVKPEKVIIVEGILTLAVPELRELADLSIFIHVDDDVRLNRRIMRDFVGGARSGFGEGTPREQLAGELSYYFEYVKPNYERYIAPLAEKADIVLQNNDKSAEPMLSRVENILTKFRLD